MSPLPGWRLVWSLCGRFCCRSSPEVLRQWRTGARACGQGPCGAVSPATSRASETPRFCDPHGPHRLSNDRGSARPAQMYLRNGHRVVLCDVDNRPAKPLPRNFVPPLMTAAHKTRAWVATPSVRACAERPAGSDANWQEEQGPFCQLWQHRFVADINSGPYQRCRYGNQSRRQGEAAQRRTGDDRDPRGRGPSPWPWPRPAVECQWFVQDVLQAAVFDPASLDRVE